MTIYLLLRPVIALAVWVAVGFLIIPEARRSKRSGLLWYLMAIAAMMVTTAITFGLVGVVVYPLAKSIEAGQSATVAMYVVGAFLAVGLGFLAVLKIRSYLRKNPKNA